MIGIGINIRNWWKNDANKAAVGGMAVIIVLLLAMTVYNGRNFSQGMAKVQASQSALRR